MKEEKDVKDVESSTTEEETQKVVNTDEGATPQPETQEPEVEPSTQEVKEEVIKDDRPIENVTWETKRKIDELYPKVDKMFELLQQGAGQQQSQQPQYSKAQLQAYAQDSGTTTEQRLWAYSEVDKLEKSERMKEYQEIMRSTQEKSEAQTRRSQSAQWVASAFPDTVVKDTTGNPMGWNQSHPVLMKANEYMSRSKTLRDDPEGFAAACKMAAFDLGVNVNKQLTKKVDRTLGQLRKEQKKQLASAGGTRSAETPETASKARMDRLKKQYAETGDKDVFAEMIKMKKLNPYL